MRPPTTRPTARWRRITRWSWFILAPLCGAVCAREYVRPELLALESAREAREAADLALADSLQIECARLESEALEEAASASPSPSVRGDLAARLALYRQVADSLRRELGHARAERREAQEGEAGAGARVRGNLGDGPALRAEIGALEVERSRLRARQAELADSVPRATSELEVLRGRAPD